MNKSLLSAVAGLVLLSLAGCVTTASRSGAEATPDGPPDIQVYAQGLSCPLCAHNLDEQLRKLSGLRDVRIDLGAGRADLWFESDVRPDDAAIARAVDDSGFTLDRLVRP
jgi:copper chaperone CopZ